MENSELDIVRSKHVPWAFTIKNVHSGPDQYDQFFKRAEGFGCIIDCKYAENDSKGKLHYHGIILIPKGLFRKKLMLHGLHLKLDELYDRAGWLKYITKDANLVPLPRPEEDELIEQWTEPLVLNRRIV